MSKVFLSFLGTSDYVECNYIFEDEKVENVHFVQEALIKLFCKDFENDDRIITFVTKLAREKNWNGNNKAGVGLESILSDSSKQTIIKAVDIPDGKSEEEIWQIFDIVYSQLQEGDRVIFDITHAFRFLPMLGMTLLQYARFLKGIQLSGIYYGAFEALGNPRDVKEMEVQERNAPIFDLSSFDTLMQWNTAASGLVNYGNFTMMADLLKARGEERSRLTKGADKQAILEKRISENIRRIQQQISTIRGGEIQKGDNFKKLLLNLEEFNEDNALSKPFKPILSKIKSIFDSYSRGDLINCFNIVEYCIEYNYIQQGITILQETIITYILDQIGFRTNIKSIREDLSSLFFVISIKKPEREWDLKNKGLKSEYRKLSNSDIFINLMPLYEKLRAYRNDINHGGFIDPHDADIFKKILSDVYKEIREVIGV